MTGDRTNEMGRESRSRFTVDTTVNIAHILTTVAMIVALFAWGTDLKTTVVTNTSEISHLKEERIREGHELKESIRALNIKMDRLIERSPSQLSCKSFGNK
tara:strand:- start:128 stop:430 length:303 start_codon:yes stop_codon:yes gene_type:complete